MSEGLGWREPKGTVYISEWEWGVAEWHPTACAAALPFLCRNRLMRLVTSDVENGRSRLRCRIVIRDFWVFLKNIFGEALCQICPSIETTLLPLVWGPDSKYRRMFCSTITDEHIHAADFHRNVVSRLFLLLHQWAP